MNINNNLFDNNLKYVYHYFKLGTYMKIMIKY